MPTIFQTILKFSLSLSLVYLFYQICLRRLTFYGWNRYYLLGYSILSFFIPFVNITPIIEKKEFSEVKMIDYIPAISQYTGVMTSGATRLSHALVFNGWNVFLMLLISGSLIMLGRLCIQLLSLQKMKRKAVILPAGEATVYQVDRQIIPFSFGNAIYLNQDMHTEHELKEIILHEYVHVRQKHTVDILLAEFLCIVNWFNPFAWLIRHAIRQNLEFIADNQLLQYGLDKQAYQYHLLKVVGTPLYQIANSFNLSSLKKRISMMNAIKSARLQLLRFLFILPLLAVLLVAFRDQYIPDMLREPRDNKKLLAPSSSPTISPKVHRINHSDTLPPAAKGTQRFLGHPFVEVKGVSLHRGDAMDKEHSDFFRRNPSVLALYWGLTNHDLIVYLDPQRMEKYDLNNAADLEKAKAKFGELPAPASGSYDAITVFGSASTEPLIFVDGKETKGINRLDPNDILSISVNKNQDTLHYGPQAKYGVIYVTTKSYVQRNKYFETGADGITVAHSNTATVGDGITQFIGNVKLGVHDFTKDILIIFNGHEYAANEINKFIRDADFDTVTIYDKHAAFEKFGEKGKNGVIVLVSKKWQSAGEAAPSGTGYSGAEQAVYRDDVSVQNGILNWEINKDYQRQPLYLIDAKPAGKDEKMLGLEKIQVSITEYAGKGDILTKYGPDAKDGIVNFVTTANKDFGPAHIFPKKANPSAEKMKEMLADAAVCNVLYIGIDNPIRITAQDIPAEELILKIDAGYGQVLKRKNGLQLVRPVIPGNVELKVYRKQKDGSLAFLNSRFFRVLPCPTQDAGSIIFAKS